MEFDSARPAAATDVLPDDQLPEYQFTRGAHEDASNHQRMNALAAYDLADWHLHQQLDAIAMRSAEALHQPFSMIALLLDNSVHVAGSHGIEGNWAHGDGDAPEEWAFCAETVLDGRPHLIPDISVEPTTSGNPVVLQEGVRSYGGFPLITPGGQIIGAHCVLGRFPHVFSPDEIHELRRTSHDIIKAFEQHPSHGDGLFGRR
jgi:GAF domain-containing protein